MNRRERRAANSRGNAAAEISPAEISRLLAEANAACHDGQLVHGEALCKRILAHIPTHKGALNLLGLIHQSSSRHRLAVKVFAKAIAADELDAAYHYNIASSYQLLNDNAAAALHFEKAVALGLSDQDAGDLLMQNPRIADGVRRAAEKAVGTPRSETLFNDGDIAAIAGDIFLRCALQSAPILGVPLERFMTQLRPALLRIAAGDPTDAARRGEDALALFCALAQQCFINEYVFAQGDEETRQAERLRDLLAEKIAAGADVSAFLLAAVAAYFPLHSLGVAQSLRAMAWPPCVVALLQQQIEEPLAEAEERRDIPSLTPIDDAVSVQVMRQYEESPYPRWRTDPLAVRAEAKRRAQRPGSDDAASAHEILVAACGTGRHVFYVAQQWPQARILAIDLSRSSLAYARRRTKEAGLRNIDYAQGDILKLGGLGRTFDRIEAIGVLHHLADPAEGWRVLLSLLEPSGIMQVGLYSEIARRTIVEARALIAERGYPANAEGIRALRRDIMADRNEQRWQPLLTSAADFYSISGCRDLFFNVMEHRFTIPQIADFITENGLHFLGFRLDPGSVDMFRRQCPAAGALTDLDAWCAFETANPQTFRRMYVFEVRKGE